MGLVKPLSRVRLMSFSLASFVPASPHVADGPFARARVRVALSPAFSRRVHPDAAVERAVEQLWTQRLRVSPRLFNGAKFRLHAWRQERELLLLQCGLTDYKAYLGTCCSELVAQLRRDGERLEGDATAFLSRKMGVSAVVETRDRRVALIERSRSVDAYQQLFDTPGGHPEPADLPFTAEDLARIDGAQKEQAETQAADRLFGSIVDEVHEEINLAPAQLSEPLLLGIVFQAEAETPSFVFHMTTELSSQDVDALYRLGPQDKFESTQLRWADKSTIDTFQLTPAAQGSLALWQQYCAFRSW